MSRENLLKMMERIPVSMKDRLDSLMKLYSKTPNLPAKDYILYKIVPGDNLFKISQYFLKNLDELAKFNGIKKTNIIYASSYIAIPLLK